MSLIAGVVVDASDVNKSDFRGYLAAREIASIKDLAYGGVGNGVAADNAAAQAGLTAGGALFVPAGTFLVTGLTTQGCRYVYGTGIHSVLKTVTNAVVLTVSNDDVTIRDLKILGDGKNSGKTSQRGISINDKYRTRMINVHGEDLGGALIYATQTYDTHDGNVASNCVARNCNIGIHADTRGEYFGAENCATPGCNIGIAINAGNFRGTNCNLSDSGTGVALYGDENDSHGSLVGCQLNHCTTYGIYADGIVNGFIFDGCAMYQSGMYLKDSLGVWYVNGQLDSAFYTFDDAFGTVIENNLMPGYYANTVDPVNGGGDSRTRWRNNHKVNGDRYPSDWGYNLNGGYAKATCGSDLSAVATGSPAAAVIYPTRSANWTSGNSSYTTDTFYSTVTGKFTVEGYGDGKVRVRTLIVVAIAGATKDNVYVELMVNSTRVAFLPVSLVLGLYNFSYDGEIHANAGDEIWFRLNNTSGGNATVKGGSDAFMECEGL